MAVESDQPQKADAPQNTSDKKASKRIRWATQKVTGHSGQTKREGILRRLSHRKAHGHEKGGPEQPQDAQPEDAQGPPGSGRRLFFNVPLPPSMRDEDGRPLATYPRNKIRTAKYTPISFIPKNLWFQFQNVANIYFLFIIIIGFFSIFGVTNPALSAVPLIIIIVITAIKDAIEDWRRTTVDNELNNAPTHRLVDWENVNTAEDSVGPWRRFKKANTRVIQLAWNAYKRLRAQKKGDVDESGKTYADRAVDVSRPSVDTRRESMYTPRSSTQVPRDEGLAMELTPVPSPTPGGHSPMGAAELDAVNNTLKPLENWPLEHSQSRNTMGQTLEVPKDQSHSDQPQIVRRNYGSLVDTTIEAPGKARFKKDYWKNVQVGDFVRLYNNEQIPADVVVLSTSDSDGVCYVETKNLDGETNLKVRNALHCGHRVRRARDCERTRFVLESEQPHANLYSYSGVIRWEEKDPRHPEAEPKEMAEPIGINNVLLRGCSVKNTDWVLGIVIFTGDESKIMLNSGITPSKRAKISKSLNWNVIYNFIILFIMCLVAAIVQGYTWGLGNQSLNFFEFGSYGGTPGLNGFINFWAAIILFQNLVPISLYISLEIVRTAQAFFIYSDTFMYYEKLDYPCTPKSWNISDDLGQIEYIFSDKTGTLTQNVMEFKKVTVNGVPYGEAYTEALAGMQKREGINVEVEGAKARKQIAEDKIKMLEGLRAIDNNPYLHDEDLTFVAPDFVQDLTGEAGPEQKAANEAFMLALALCHTVIAERIPGDMPKIEFRAQSPDEAALVATAKDCGYTVLPNNGDDMILSIQGREERFTVLNTLEFNSARKRMSIIIRMPDGKIRLYCKGADSIIYSRLSSGEQPELRKTTAEHLEMFAREGLRTLCIAQRDLSEEEYQTWQKDHEIAAAAIQDREDKIEAVSDRIERGLTLLGGTAIEDRLQDGVPDSIALLGLAGIKLWVLTGDKVETAINIGFSCNLLDNDMDLIILKIDDGDMAKAEAELDRHLASFGKTGSDAELKAAKKNHEPPDPTHALVVDGDTLRLMLDDSLKQKFLLLCKECKSVLCCRVSPAQKAAVVAMVKNGLDVITLSIGDGANDVSMIQEAHVGVGIAGEEGRQAVMSSDYAIGQFRYLSRLLLVHGRWSYRRLAETIANFFYKNIVWTFALFWYNIYDNFDCSYVFDYTYILLYNLAFTSLPIIFLGILDQDVSDKVSLAVPQLYRRGIERKEWTDTKFWLYMGDALYQSAICFYMPYLLFSAATFETPSGRNVNDYQQFGVYIAHATIIVVNVYVLMNTYRWDWFIVLMTAISILLVFFWTGVYTSFTSAFTFYNAARNCYGTLSFWVVTLLTIIICLLPRFAAKSFQKIFMPLDVDVIREQVRQGKFAYLDEVDPSNLVAPVQPPTEKEMEESASSSELSKPIDQRKVSHSRHRSPHHEQDDERRPFYPPSVTNTATTYHPYSPQGSDGTVDLHSFRNSLDRAFPPVPSSRDGSSAPAHNFSNLNPNAPQSSTQAGNNPSRNDSTQHYDTNGNNFTLVRPPGISPIESEATPRHSFDRPRPSFDRVRQSMERSRTRPSFEQSRDFTSAALLQRVESSHSFSTAKEDGTGGERAEGRLSREWTRPELVRDVSRGDLAGIREEGDGARGESRGRDMQHRGREGVVMRDDGAVFGIRMKEMEMELEETEVDTLDYEEQEDSEAHLLLYIR
ncbi:phospholipid-transporting ATPase DNF1 [Elsinoe australis]|uniref:Phospholipid-transporting ATPase n=1 Tax=Elsinoe australis TaxID=40998 RepID=A0A4U7ATS4_9PEZI|nr:phospholipid-transporting ATPase DNF1 [Elsinoe australis]